MLALVILAAAAFTFYSVVCGMIWLLQERLIFFPESLAPEFRFSFPLPCEERWLDAAGARVHSLLFRAPGSRGVLLYFHGNAGSLANWGEVAARLAKATGWDVWIVDYPGYGKSEGSLRNEKQLHEVALALWEAAEKEYPAGKLVLYGRSIGSGIAARLAAARPAAGVVLESPYVSLRSLVREKFPWVPVPLLLRYAFRSDRWLPRVACPCLIVHGTNDEVIPVAHGKRLSELAKKVRFVPVENGAHNDLVVHQSYWDGLLGFLRRDLGGGPASLSAEHAPEYT